MFGTVISEPMARRVLEVVDNGLSQGLGSPIYNTFCLEAAINRACGNLAYSDKPTCVNPAIRRISIALNDRNEWLSNADRADGLRRLAIAQLGTDTIDSVEFVDNAIVWLTNSYVTKAIDYAADRIVNTDREAASALKNLLTPINSVKDTDQIELALVKFRSIHYDANLNFLPNLIGYTFLKNVRFLLHNILIAAQNAQSANRQGDMHAYAAAESFNCAVSSILDILYYPDAKRAFLIEIAEGIVKILIGMGSQGSAFIYLTEKK